MQIVTLPLRLSLAGVRLTGYLVESNLRAGQVYCRAAMEANPLITSRAGSKAPMARSKPAKAVRTKLTEGKKKRQPSAPPVMPEGPQKGAIRLS